MKINNYQTAERAAFEMLGFFYHEIGDKPHRPLNIALSGGETVRTLFQVWLDDYAILIPHEQLRFFWVDERCVPPIHAASNYGMAEELLLKPVHIPDSSVHRIIGENSPREEDVQ